MKALILAAALTTMSGCAVASNKPAWYVPQGFNLSECGPSVAAMADRWATGTMTTRFATRATNRRGVNMFGWWSLNNVQQYLTSRGIKSQFVDQNTPLPHGAMGIYNVGAHFVSAVRTVDSALLVADPMNGTDTRTLSDMTGANISGAYLLVIK